MNTLTYARKAHNTIDCFLIRHNCSNLKLDIQEFFHTHECIVELTDFRIQLSFYIIGQKNTCDFTYTILSK